VKCYHHRGPEGRSEVRVSRIDSELGLESRWQQRRRPRAGNQVSPRHRLEAYHGTMRPALKGSQDRCSCAPAGRATSPEKLGLARLTGGQAHSLEYSRRKVLSPGTMCAATYGPGPVNGDLHLWKIFGWDLGAETSAAIEIVGASCYTAEIKSRSS